MSEIRDRRDLGAFIPSSLDDYPLNAYEFRVYAHIVRRVGKSNCFESIPNMAAHCRMNPKTVCKALKVLIAANLISCEERSGKTNLYTLEAESDWAKPSELNSFRNTPPKLGGGTPPPNQGPLPPPNQGDEGSTIKGIPIKESLSPTSPSEPEQEKPRERILKVSEENQEPEQREKQGYPLDNLTPDERAAFEKFVRADWLKVKNEEIRCFHRFMAKKEDYDTWHERFLNSSAGREAKKEAIAAQHDWRNDSRFDVWIWEGFRRGAKWIHENEAEREERKAFDDWADYSGAYADVCCSHVATGRLFP